jgi:hypothetical protein
VGSRAELDLRDRTGVTVESQSFHVLTAPVP